MKNRSKALLLALCALMLVVTTVFTTLAYLTDEVEITNTFTIGNVTITLTETETDEYGVAANDPATTTDAGNEYKLIPGREYIKDPVITLSDNSEDAYVFVRVVNGLSKMIAGNPVNIEGGTTIAAQMAAKGWVAVDGETDVFMKEAAVGASDTVEVFDTVTIKNDADVAPFAGATIVVTAYAVQADGFGTAQAAWDATFGA